MDLMIESSSKGVWKGWTIALKPNARDQRTMQAKKPRAASIIIFFILLAKKRDMHRCLD
ncbi:hypothetical protein DFA_08721 [Cavenderia fasciculata]|uniref:Uncharacterized protein n=1 Tax=Cavenderia fasciculata TaxID=261658 RepID=F4Q3W7_CACFS|nr:uncharacterized protein DFA_08721 [Cavenderia fasciculata]EGG17723.1 hypothetical protein DFA_08721 [Cavenderia fasciculata]|eukprot:XP_004356207.1 hypothetical protein DFA_08721 [Cavenderia fasciculata]